MKRVLITGITGMIGKHLANLLTELGYQVAGFSRATSSSRYLETNGRDRFYQGDIMDRNFLKEVWTDWNPEIVFHLAAQAYNGESWKAEDSTYSLNIQGSRNVFEACLAYSPNARIIPACSSASYGLVPADLLPIDEDRTPLQPISPYGVSKASMEMMARQFHLNYGLDIVLPRLFIHVGPDHPPVTALQNFARQLARIYLGKQKPEIQVGNLESSRDFVDVRDGVRALCLLAEKAEAGSLYNICTGKAWTMRESLGMLIDISGTSVKIVNDPKLLRPSDEKVLVGNPSKLKGLGWSPEISFETTLSDIYTNWIKRLA